MSRALRLFLAVAAALAAALALVPGAADARVLARSAEPFSAPVLAGERVLVTRFAPNGGLEVVSLGAAGDAQSLVTATSESTFLYDASASVAAVSQGFLVPETSEGFALFTGPPSGPVTKVVECEGFFGVARPVAVDGDRIALAGRDCHQDHVSVSTADGPPQTVDAGAHVTRVALAGRYLAWITEGPGGPRAAVYDLVAGAVAYEIQTGSEPRSIAVGADGTAVVASFTINPGATRTRCGGISVPRVTWHSLADPSAHDVGEADCSTAIRFVAGRLAYYRRSPTSGESQLLLTNLDGTDQRPVAEFERHFAPGDSFDFDGDRLVWDEARCRDHALVERSAADASTPDPALSCPVRVSNLRLGRDGIARVRIGCPNGCRTEAGQGLRVFAPRWLHIRGRRNGVTRYSPSLGFDLRPGGRATLRLRLTARQQRIARRKGRTSVRIRVVGQHIYSARLKRTLIAR